MDQVKINSVAYNIIKAPTDDVEQVYKENDSCHFFPILAVTGVVERNDRYYECAWYIDNELTPDASLWVNDWDTADQLTPLPDYSPRKEVF